MAFVNTQKPTPTCTCVYMLCLCELTVCHSIFAQVMFSCCDLEIIYTKFVLIVCVSRETNFLKYC